MGVGLTRLYHLLGLHHHVAWRIVETVSDQLHPGQATMLSSFLHLWKRKETQQLKSTTSWQKSRHALSHRAASPKYGITTEQCPTSVQDKYTSPSSFAKTLCGDVTGSDGTLDPPASGLEHATLQEACLMLCPHLLRRSKERQSVLKERARNRCPPVNSLPSKTRSTRAVTGDNRDRPVMADFSINKPRYEQFIPMW